MKYEGRLEDKRTSDEGMWRADRTSGVLNDLERKMYAHFGKKTSEDHLLNSQDDEPELRVEQQPKGKNTFKLFTKPNSQPMSINELEKPTPSKEPKKQSSNINGKSHMGQLIEEVEAIEILVRKKLALKQERVAQLQREISLETEEKVHLYRTNCQLEQELQDVLKGKRIQQQKLAHQQKMLQEQLKRLSKIYQQRKNEGKKLKKEEELLKDTLKSTHNHRKRCLESQIRAKSKSKQKLVKKQQKTTHHAEQEQYLRGLVVELDRLKNMVKQKMKKQRSKLKLK